jgi:hypothetical protein
MERPFQESSHAFGLVTAGEQAVGEVAFEEHALAERGLARPVHGLADRRDQGAATLLDWS